MVDKLFIIGYCIFARRFDKLFATSIKGGVQRSGGSGIRFADSDDLSEAKGSLN